MITLLGPANRNGIANRVNDVCVVGSLWAPGSTTTLAFYYRNGVMTDLGTLGGASSDARGLNDDGDVVGTAAECGRAASRLPLSQRCDDRSEYAAAAWNRLGASNPQRAVSNGGQIVGYGSFNGKRRAFLLTPPTDLVPRIGGTISQHDSNLPRDGIEVGKTIEWTTSAIAPPFSKLVPDLYRRTDERTR